MKLYQKSILAISLTAFASSASAIEVVDKKLEIYGKIHLSVDSADKDDPAVNNDGLSVSSNSSRLGFKGELPAGPLKFVYQIEQEVKFDEGGSEFATRNTYAGLKGGFGKVILGHYDTPFKTVGSKWGIFGDTVGERRAILGASYSDNNQLNERAQNAIVYEYKGDALKFQLLHAVDPESGDDGVADNTDRKVTSAGLFYKGKKFWFGVAHESWDQHSRAGNVDATRVAANYNFGVAKVGLIYETIDSDDELQWNRDVWGVNALFKVAKHTDVRLQALRADDADNQADTGATKLGLGVFHKLDKNVQVYLAYAQTDNDTNAAFQAVDGGHGDEVKTVDGGEPKAFSAGFIYKF